MTCEEFTQALTAFSLNELDPPQAEACRVHLAGCARCTNLALRDHQLVSRLRAAAVPAPATVHHAVAVALRQETRTHERRRRPVRAAAAGLAAAAAAMLAILALGPDPRTDEAQTPLAAAWVAYEAGELPLDPGVEVPASLLTMPLPDLAEFGLYPVHSGSLRLAGRPALATEYMDGQGKHFTVFRWVGKLPDPAQGNPAADPPNVITSTWDGTTSSWWESDGVVFCAVGDLPRARLDLAVDHLRKRVDQA